MATNPRKKTQHPIHEVFRVLKETRTGALIFQRELRQPIEINGVPNVTRVPEGHFCRVAGRIYCPKKRGETVLVCYTSVFEEQI